MTDGPKSISVIGDGIENIISTNQVARTTHFDGNDKENGSPSTTSKTNPVKTENQEPRHPTRADSTLTTASWVMSEQIKKPVTCSVITGTVKKITQPSSQETCVLNVETHTGDVCIKRTERWRRNEIEDISTKLEFLPPPPTLPRSRETTQSKTQPATHLVCHSTRLLWLEQ